jgi:hypothetical protein
MSVKRVELSTLDMQDNPLTNNRAKSWQEVGDWKCPSSKLGTEEMPPYQYLMCQL